MKITQFNLKIFRDMVVRFEQDVPDLLDACDKWLEVQKVAGTYQAFTTDAAQRRRYDLEQKLTEIRQDMAAIYDFMGDRGFVNFTPTDLTVQLTPDLLEEHG